MRTRNIKINVFLNEDEKQMLLEKSHKFNLSQSDFFRLLIQDYSIDKVLNKELEETWLSSIWYLLIYQNYQMNLIGFAIMILQDF